MTVPALGATIGFITFIASTISSVSPAATCLPGADERRGAGLGGQIGGADHRRLDRAGMIGGGGQRGRRRRGGRRRAGAAAAGAAHCARRGRRDRHRARDADAAIAVLHLDLGQAGGVEQFGELADQPGIDLHGAAPAGACR